METMPKALPFCVLKSTGKPLPTPQAAEIRKQIDSEQPSGAMAVLLAARAVRGNQAFALASDLDPDDLEKAGWGVLFGTQVSDEIKSALQPLLELRESQAKKCFFRFEGKTGFKPGMSARNWIALRGGSFLAADPRDGVPYYLMIVAAPDDIPFEFQYDLDLARAVGRLWFDKAEDFERYAKSVCEQESRDEPLRPREIALFGTRHDYDDATQMFHDHVAKPLHEGKGMHPPIGEKEGFSHFILLGEAAKRKNITDLFLRPCGAPALLLTGSHGLGLEIDDPCLLTQQGAIVCADWPGQGAIASDHVLTGGDLPADADLAGMIHFFFACYGAGCPQTDNFSRHLPVPPAIAPRAFIGYLPQALLAHPKGSALAVIGHIERAWTYSFLNEYGMPQLNLFRDVLAELMAGKRVGHAMEKANTIWATHSSQLADLMFREERGDADVDTAAIEAIWVARDDARNLVVLGDPAVRLALGPSIKTVP